MIDALWRKGRICPSASGLPIMSEARAMSKDTPDFKNEFSEIETMMNSIGAEVVIARKGYCELAGRGTEHAWSSSKDLFRKENSSLTNEHRAADLKSRTQFSWKKYPLKR